MLPMNDTNYIHAISNQASNCHRYNLSLDPDLYNDPNIQRQTEELAAPKLFLSDKEGEKGLLRIKYSIVFSAHLIKKIVF